MNFSVAEKPTEADKRTKEQKFYSPFVSFVSFCKTAGEKFLNRSKRSELFVGVLILILLLIMPPSPSD
jgi:hypothetical protein